MQELERDKQTAWHMKLKEIGIFWGGSLIMQTVVGPGIFTSPKGVIAGAGSVGLSFIIWALCGIFSTLAALCFAELQIFVRRAGCEYGYIHKAYGPFPAFIYTWMRTVFAEPCTTAVFAQAFASYVSESLADDCGPPKMVHSLLAVLAILTLTIVNCYNVGLARQMVSVSNIAKIITISIICLCGIYNLLSGNSKSYERLQEGFDHTENRNDVLIFAVYNSLWAYGGWANVPSVTAGVKKPPKNVPRLVKIVIPTVMVIYLLSMNSFLTVLSREELESDHIFGVLWGERMLGDFGFIIPVGVSLIALGNANNTFVASGRLSSVSVQDGYVPELLTYKSVRTKSHVPAIILRAIMATSMAVGLTASVMVRFWIFTVWLFHGLSIFGLLVMRIRKPHLTRPYKVNILIPVIVSIGAAYIVISPFITSHMKPELIFSMTVAGSSVIFYVPFVKWNWGGKIVDRFTMFFQLLLEVVPEKKIERRKRFKKSRRPASIAPMNLSTIEERDIDVASSVDRGDGASIATISDIFTIATYDDIASIDDLESCDELDSNSENSPSESQNYAPPGYDGLFEYSTRL
ncbi:hypothetical protein FSP39_003249 [Pinctada imbricata]|uniref:Uncharacterized protein n=1 Tax=Pinctada imbricata TaxID=66713 RepID=A0AA88XQ78_PINIB|nr:hypothetical protein FSP39_003249 [Pinctada imbricata]